MSLGIYTLLVIAVSVSFTCAQDALQEQCGDQAPFAGLFSQIEKDLRHWPEGSITQDMMDWVAEERDSRWKTRRVAFLIEDGEAYLIRCLAWVMLKHSMHSTRGGFGSLHDLRLKPCHLPAAT